VGGFRCFFDLVWGLEVFLSVLGVGLFFFLSVVLLNLGFFFVVSLGMV